MSFDGLKYRVDKLKKNESVLLKWPEIAAGIDIFGADDLPEGLDVELVMKYIIVMYTPGTPAIEMYPHVGKRKAWVLAQLGIKDDNGSYDRIISDMVLYRNAAITKRILYYLQIQGNVDWGNMCHAEEQITALREKEAPDDYSKALDYAKLIGVWTATYNEAKSNLLKADRSRVLEDSLDEFRAQVSQGIRPEEIVLRNIQPIASHLQKANRIFPEVKEN